MNIFFIIMFLIYILYRKKGSVCVYLYIYLKLINMLYKFFADISIGKKLF